MFDSRGPVTSEGLAAIKTRQQLGHALRAAREHAQLSLRELAARAKKHRAKVPASPGRDRSTLNKALIEDMEKGNRIMAGKDDRLEFYLHLCGIDHNDRIPWLHKALEVHGPTNRPATSPTALASPVQDEQDLRHSAGDTDAGAGTDKLALSWAGMAVMLDEKGQQLPQVAELDPYRLGATESRYGDRDRYDSSSRDVATDPYVPRAVDAELQAAVAQRQLTVVIGPSKAGKSRTLFEALTYTWPEASVLVPAREKLDALPELPTFTASGEPIVVWLDDLEKFLTGPQRLTPGRLAHLLARPAPTTIVATMRREAHDRLHDPEKGELTDDVGELLRQATIIELESTIDDPAEQAAAETAYPDADLAHYRALRYGLGEVLAGAPAVLERYERAARIDPPLRAVIEAAIDWARIGRFDPIPEPTLAELAIHTLRRNRPDHDPTPGAIATAIHNARTRVEASAHIAALIPRWLDDDTRGYRPFDYLTAADDGQHNHAPRPIPEQFWHTATRHADNDTLATVGLIAYLRGHLDIALGLTRRAADIGDIGAMYNVGVLLQQRGDLTQAETWWQRAADIGHTGAMNNLGNLLHERGDLAEAETWYRKAADAGHTRAMYNLAALLRQHGDLAEAETWYRKAADTGHTRTMYNLGVLFQQRGDLTQAETWWQRAADIGDIGAMYNLGHLLQQRGDLAEAETWWQRAASAGYARAMNNLGHLLRQRGDLVGAETWYRKAADAGHTRAMYNLGVRLKERGDLTQAETWWQRAAGAGDIDAMYNLGHLLRERGDLAIAETWWQRAADTGHAGAMNNLGVLLQQGGDLVGAETWYRKAADASYADAMTNLNDLLRLHGDLDNDV